MRRRSPKEPTTEDAPDSIAPWEMLDESAIAAWTGRMRERYPLRNLTVIARRMDQDTLACFDKGPDAQGKAVVVFQKFGDPEETHEAHYPGFSAWFDDVLAASRAWNTGR